MHCPVQSPLSLFKSNSIEGCVSSADVLPTKDQPGSDESDVARGTSEVEASALRELDCPVQGCFTTMAISKLSPHLTIFVKIFRTIPPSLPLKGNFAITKFDNVFMGVCQEGFCFSNCLVSKFKHKHKNKTLKLRAEIKSSFFARNSQLF